MSRVKVDDLFKQQTLDELTLIALTLNLLTLRPTNIFIRKDLLSKIIELITEDSFYNHLQLQLFRVYTNKDY